MPGYSGISARLARKHSPWHNQVCHFPSAVSTVTRQGFGSLFSISLPQKQQGPKETFIISSVVVVRFVSTWLLEQRRASADLKFPPTPRFRPRPCNSGFDLIAAINQFFFSRSRISPSRTSVLVGSAGAGASAGFLKRSSCLMTMKITKATIRKLTTTVRNWPQPMTAPASWLPHRSFPSERRLRKKDSGWRNQCRR